MSDRRGALQAVRDVVRSGGALLLKPTQRSVVGEASPRARAATGGVRGRVPHVRVFQSEPKGLPAGKIRVANLLTIGREQPEVGTLSSRSWWSEVACQC